jgi:putative SOS response-associated peptidase YedK
MDPDNSFDCPCRYHKEGTGKSQFQIRRDRYDHLHHHQEQNADHINDHICTYPCDEIAQFCISQSFCFSVHSHSSILKHILFFSNHFIYNIRMCGRYIFYDQKNAHLKAMIDQAKEQFSEKVFAEISLFEVFPGQKAFAGIYDTEKKAMRIKVMQWGLAMKDKLVINARCESLMQSSFFQGVSLCAIPASSYFEWTAAHQKYEFSSDDETIYLAGIARCENGQWHFAIVTEEAGRPQAEIHPRQPLVFSYEDAKKWCSAEDPTSMYASSIQKRIAAKV